MCKRCNSEKPAMAFAKCNAWARPRTYVCIDCKARERRKRYREATADVPRRRYTPQLTDEQVRTIKRSGEMECARCHQVKPLGQFHRRKKGRLSRTRSCRVCRNAQHAQWKARNTDAWWRSHTAYKGRQYGITVDQFIEMLEVQDHRCAICRKPLGTKGTAIDHDHNTGRVRGLVHSHCNLVIGNANEDVSVLFGAIRYLKRHRNVESRGVLYAAERN
jgi:hypothetical protein